MRVLQNGGANPPVFLLLLLLPLMLLLCWLLLSLLWRLRLLRWLLAAGGLPPPDADRSVAATAGQHIT